MLVAVWTLASIKTHYTYYTGKLVHYWTWYIFHLIAISTDKSRVADMIYYENLEKTIKILPYNVFFTCIVKSIILCF